MRTIYALFMAALLTATGYADDCMRVRVAPHGSSYHRNSFSSRFDDYGRTFRGTNTRSSFDYRREFAREFDAKVFVFDLFNIRSYPQFYAPYPFASCYPQTGYQYPPYSYAPQPTPYQPPQVQPVPIGPPQASTSAEAVIQSRCAECHNSSSANRLPLVDNQGRLSQLTFAEKAEILLRSNPANRQALGERAMPMGGNALTQREYEALQELVR